MKYNNVVIGIFMDRPNRFIAHVDLDGVIETVHVKNTGRCKELLIPDCKVVLEKSDNVLRKTKYDLIAVYKENFGWVNIDSQAPNKVVSEWLNESPILFDEINQIKPEYTYGSSRIDFFLNNKDQKVLIEVKGCTLENNGIGYFPDAPTQRGVKHIIELSNALDEGYKCYLAFVIAMPNVKKVLPNYDTHPQFGEILNFAIDKGVKVLYLMCDVQIDSLKIIDYSVIEKLNN